MGHNTIAWAVFGVVLTGMLALDLGVFHRRAHFIHVKEALGWSAMWIGVALLFNLAIYFWYQDASHPHAALEFLTGYLIEKSLSVDNIFVFLLIFSYFRVEPRYQHRVLFYGILGALAMRAVFIAAGVTLIHRFEWVVYIFGGILIFSGFKMAVQKEKQIHPERNPVLNLFRRLLPVTGHYEGGKFFLQREGRLWATPLMVVLLVVETSDLIFAVDSIPAVLAITRDPFIVYTSNAFAILGLRSLYFALAGVMELFNFLHYGLALILVFVGLKMISAHHYKIPTGIALGVIAGILAISIIASLLRPRKPTVS
jgi:tellurite resistance protein TerC